MASRRGSATRRKEMKAVSPSCLNLILICEKYMYMYKGIHPPANSSSMAGKGRGGGGAEGDEIALYCLLPSFVGLLSFPRRPLLDDPPTAGIKPGKVLMEAAKLRRPSLAYSEVEPCALRGPRTVFPRA